MSTSTEKRAPTGYPPLSTVLRMVIFFAYAVAYIGLVASGRLGKIIHPRMFPWIAGAGILFLVLGLHSATTGWKTVTRTDDISFFAPLALALALVMIFLGTGVNPASRFDSLVPFQTGIVPGRQGGPRREKQAASPVQAPLPARITFTDETYWTMFNRVYDGVKTAAGKHIIVQGFLVRDRSFPPGVALVGRNLMWCCSADMAVIGFLVRSPDLARLQDSTWVEVSGSLSSIVFDISGSGKAVPVPLIQADAVRPAHRTESEIIFPN